MAQLRMMEHVVLPGGVGLLSGSAQLLEDNVRATQLAPNVFLRNAAPIADYGLGAYGVVNHMMDLGLPRAGASEMAAAGIAVAVRRATYQIGDMVLGLRRTVTKAPARVRSNARVASDNGRVPADTYPVMSDNDEVLVTRG